MKIRTDFVTNSSSSCFVSILAIKQDWTKIQLDIGSFEGAMGASLESFLPNTENHEYARLMKKELEPYLSPGMSGKEFIDMLSRQKFFQWAVEEGAEDSTYDLETVSNIFDLRHLSYAVQTHVDSEFTSTTSIVVVGKPGDPLSEREAFESQTGFKVKNAKSSSNKLILKEYTGSDAAVRIPFSAFGNKVIAEIGPNAFKGNRSITSVQVEEGICRIGDKAFAQCPNLEKVKLPLSAKEMGKGVFDDCPKLNQQVSAKGTAAVGKESPYKMDSSPVPVAYSSLESLVNDMQLKKAEMERAAEVPASDSAIPEAGKKEPVEEREVPPKVLNTKFFEMQGTTMLSYSASYSDAKRNQYLKDNVIVPDGITAIEGTFYNCKHLRSAVLPDGLIRIGKSAFYNCENLKSVVLPEGLEEIDDDAFRNCSKLETITLPESLKYIGEHAFSGCSRLASVSFPEGLNTIAPGGFSYCTKLKSVHISNGLRHIGEQAFSGCRSITDIVIPNSVITMEKECFSGCRKIKTVKLSDSIKILESKVFHSCSNLSKVILPAQLNRIDNEVFRACNKLQTIILPEGLKEIGLQAFAESGLKKVVIPKGTMKIERECFRDCADLADVYLPETLSFLGVRAFQNCKNVSVHCADEKVQKMLQKSMQ